MNKKSFIKSFTLILIISLLLLPTLAFAEELQTNNSTIQPMWEVRYEFDYYDAEYSLTNDTKYYLGEFTAKNYSYTQSMDANYSQTQSATVTSSFTTSVSVDGKFKAKVIEIGTSVTFSGANSVSVYSGFTYSTGSKISPRKQATITLYNKGIAITGAKVYKMYGIEGEFLGYDYRPDSGYCWFPKLNAKTATLSSETPVQ